MIKLSKEAQEALADKSPLTHPWCFYPRGYPRHSPGFDVAVKPDKPDNWHFKKRGDR